MLSVLHPLKDLSHTVRRLHINELFAIVNLGMNNRNNDIMSDA